jgi:hypothetical protein
MFQQNSQVRKEKNTIEKGKQVKVLSSWMQQVEKVLYKHININSRRQGIQGDVNRFDEHKRWNATSSSHYLVPEIYHQL